MKEYQNKKRKKKKQFIFLILVFGVFLGWGMAIIFSRAMTYTSTDDYCQKCHIHTEADASWKLSTHVNNPSGTTTHCVECHLPPKNSFSHYLEKGKSGIAHIWNYYTKDASKFDWEAKSQLENAIKIVYNESCKTCHNNLLPIGLNDDGIIAHLYYEENEKKLNLQCISCHLDVGHYNPNAKHERMTGIPKLSVANAPKFDEATKITKFSNFTEKIPGTPVSFNMIAIPGGVFEMGSPENEPFRKSNEGPVRKVTISPFFMAEIEVTWDQFWAFYSETVSQGRIPPNEIFAANEKVKNIILEQLNIHKTNEKTEMIVDAISGPTPPFGSPEQGWGGVNRPAISMTHYAAEMFCLWLSQKTGKHYRLPTEAEWEYAARGGTQTPYFFEGNPKKFSEKGFFRKIFGADTTNINTFVVYEKNSGNKTGEPSRIGKNPFGLKNMLGNVLEYCSDWYVPDSYMQTEIEVTNPKGSETGTERVVRGGNYMSKAEDVRCAARFSTQHENWMRTDPQIPKSIWWYSDMKGVGFRVVLSSEY